MWSIRRVHHRSELTERDWGNTVQGLDKVTSTITAKKAIDLDRQNKKFARASCLFVHFFANVEMPNFKFCGGSELPTFDELNEME